MKKGKVNATIRKQVKQIKRYCRDIAEDFDKDAVHDMRVAVKTLRSFLRLLHMNIHKPQLKISKKLKRLYHIAGAIRDAQLELETIKKEQPELLHYISHLHDLIDRQKKEWKKHYSKKTINTFGHKLLKE